MLDIAHQSRCVYEIKIITHSKKNRASTKNFAKHFVMDVFSNFLAHSFCCAWHIIFTMLSTRTINLIFKLMKGGMQCAIKKFDMSKSLNCVLRATLNDGEITFLVLGLVTET